MKVIIQRSKNASVSVDGKEVGKIPFGLTILVGFTHDDTSNDINYIVKKVVNLRIFDDESGVMNKSILDIQGSILSVSQFTLFADTKKGNRPSYMNALNGDEAIKMYEEFNTKLSEFVSVQTGIFGADMLVAIENDGPVTIIIDSKNK